MGTLSVVATPIGNLGDITLRALETLKQADVIFCEDTRVTGKLLAKYAIKKPLQRADEHKAIDAARNIFALLSDGKRVVLVSDAGTPAVSDPGGRLVAYIRAHAPEATIEAIPGPSALTAALSIAGIAETNFVFLGFLPHKKGRETLFKEIATSPRTTVFYESPHRIEKALATLARVLQPSSRVTTLRELTKLHEHVVTGSPEEVHAHFAEKVGEQRGEFVVIVSP